MKARFMTFLLLASISPRSGIGIELSQLKFDGATEQTTSQSSVDILSQLSPAKKSSSLTPLRESKSIISDELKLFLSGNVAME